MQRVNRLRPTSLNRRVCSELNSVEQTEQRLELEARLKHLVQRPYEEHHSLETPQRQASISATAELYRLASLLHLQRVCPLYADDDARLSYLEQAFSVLSKLKIVTSPWPLFIVACESTSDEHRMAIMTILDRMGEVRRIGNVNVLREVIETFWKQHDLRIGSGSPDDLSWWNWVDCQTAEPWFI